MIHITAVIYCDSPGFEIKLDRLHPESAVGTLVVGDYTDRAEMAIDRAAAERIIAALRPLVRPAADAKSAEITIALAGRIAAGMDVRTAIDDLFGAGAYERIAGEIYDALREKAGVA